MNIGPAERSDIPELIDMMCLAYRPDLRKRFAVQHEEDCTYELHQSRVGKADGKVVSYVRISDRPIRVGRATVSMGGVGGVSTHPEYRGRGYNSLVLGDSIRYMKEEGYDLSMLFTGITNYYAKLGWVPFPEHSITVSPGAVPGSTGQRRQPPFRLNESSLKGKKALAFKPFDEKRDLAGVMDIYHAHNRERAGTLVRTPDYWRCGHSRFMGVMPAFVARQGRRPVAYVKCGRDERRVNVPEVGYLPDCPEAAWSMARFLVDYAIEREAEQINFRLGRLHPLPEIVCEVSNGRMSHSEGEGMMLLIVDLVSLLTKIAPELRRRLRNAGFSDAKATIGLSADQQRATLRIGDGDVKVEAGLRGRVWLSLGMRPLLRMVMGDATFSQMSGLLHVHGVRVSPRSASLLDALFPRQDLVYWGCDHF